MVNARVHTRGETPGLGGLAPSPSARRPSGMRLTTAGQPVELVLADLGTQALVRMRPLDMGHVAALAEVPQRWPAIVVARRSMRVLDGLHRVAAARRLGMKTIAATLFEGDENEAFVLAVRSNSDQGLPLSLPERTRAARQMLGFSPQRSDRAIGEICGLDHKTVSRLRSEAPPSGGDPHLDARVGRDQRSRPVDVASLRSRIAAAVSETPNHSLRQIAHRVGTSPETVRDVRARLARGESPIPLGARPVARNTPSPRPHRAALPKWATDSACRAEPGRAEFASWFDAGARSIDWPRFVDVVPLSRAYSIADQARTYAEAWRSFAEALESRTRGGTSRTR